jgi:hypothetical protein
MAATAAVPTVTPFDLLRPRGEVGAIGLSAVLADCRATILTALTETTYWSEVLPLAPVAALPASMMRRPGFVTGPEDFAYTEFSEYTESDDLAW